jgi:microcystin-dependent protein
MSTNFSSEQARGGEQINLVPIGTIVVYAGPHDPNNRISLGRQGWAFCNGLPLFKDDYPELYAVVRESYGGGYDPITGTRMADFNLPDLRGRFVRGLDDEISGRDPDSDSRVEMIRGGNSGRNVGSVQSFATAVPHSVGFTTTSNGMHGHGISTNGSHTHGMDKDGEHNHQVGHDSGERGGNLPLQRIRERQHSFSGQNVTDHSGNHRHAIHHAGDHSHDVSQNGDHAHSILGGDRESRPINAALNWIIFVGRPIDVTRLNEQLMSRADAKSSYRAD